MSCDNTSILIQSLQNPELFPNKVKNFRVIETHISWVLLTGDFAYKIKKPLNLGFLDFSTLEKRRYFCYEELRLNSRLAKDLYLDVVAICGTEKQPTLNGSGPVFEYAVKMKQFEYDQTFNDLLLKNELTEKQIIQTAGIVAAFHQRIDSASVDAEFGSVDAVLKPVLQNFKQILELKGVDHPECLKQLTLWSKKQHKRLMPLFIKRKKEGCIRECHGDLHLRNIAVIEGEVVPFDGIEFNPSLYWIDVVNDIAFLIMDLQDKKQQGMAFQFVNTYLQYNGDYEGLRLLRFYLVYRAMVMAKVSAIRANQRAGSIESQQDISRYHGYLDLAESYTRTQVPVLIMMQGVSGSGKSWLSEQMISRYQAIRIRSDIVRKQLHHLAVHSNTGTAVNEGVYSQASSDMTYQTMLKLVTDILESGFHGVVDATFLQLQQRKQFILLAEQLQIRYLIVNTRATKHTLMQRIKERSDQRDNVSDADDSVLEMQLASMQALTQEEQANSVEIDTDDSEQLSQLWKTLDQYCLVD